MINNPPSRSRLRLVLALVALAAGVFFARDLLAWLRFGLGSSLYSYTLLVPFICYVFTAQTVPVGVSTVGARRGRMVCWALGVGAVALALFGGGADEAAPPPDRLRLAILVTLVVAGLAVYGGLAWFRPRRFPLVFLYAMIPLPPLLERGLNDLLQNASGVAAYGLFRLIGMPVLQEGHLLMLPNLLLEVAEECSGIRSTLVLLLTALLASYVLLKKPLHRLLVVAVVIPLGIVRNALRIVIIGWLTVRVDPEVIHGPLHRNGGPLFFALTLLIFLGLVAWLRRREQRERNEVERMA